MDVSLRNECFHDKFAAAAECHSPTDIDNEKSKILDFESFLATVSDVNESFGKEIELNLPLTIISCVDTLIENSELHKFDSINTTLSSNFIENSVVSSESVSENSLSKHAFCDFERIDTSKSTYQKFEDCPKPEIDEGASCGVNISRMDSYSVALHETDHIPSNDILKEKEEMSRVYETNEMLSIYETNNIEVEKTEFQSKDQTRNFVNMPFKQSNKLGNIENAEVMCIGQLNGSEDCEMQLSVDVECDPSQVSGIMPFKDSLKSIEMDKKSFKSNSNKVFVKDLFSAVENCEPREEEMIELDENESEAKGSSNKKCYKMKKIGEESKNQYECDILKRIENNVNLKEKDETNNTQGDETLEFQSNDQTENFLNVPFKQSNKSCNIQNDEAIYDRQLNGSEDCEMQLPVNEETDQSKVSGILSFKDSVKSIEMDKNSCKSNSNKVFVKDLYSAVENCEPLEEQMIELDENESDAKGNSNEKYCKMENIDKKSENHYEFGLNRIENDVNLKENDADVFKNSKDKCSLAHNELHFSSDIKSCKVVLERLKPHILKRYFQFPNLNPIQIIQTDVEKDRSFNTDSEEKSLSKLDRNLIPKNIQDVNEGKEMICQGNAYKTDKEKYNSKPKQVGRQFSVGKNIYIDSAMEMFNTCSSLIKCSMSTNGKLMGISLLNESFDNEQENEIMKKSLPEKLNSKLRNDTANFKSLKIFSSKISEGKETVTILNKNHVLDSHLIKKQENIQKKEFKGISRGSTYLRNLKPAKRSQKSNEVTDVKNKKWMHKSSLNMKLNIKSNNFNEKNSHQVKYNEKEIHGSYSIKECKIVLEKLDVNAYIYSKIVHIDKDVNQSFKSQKHLLKKHGTNKIRDKCVKSAKWMKKHILKTTVSFNTKSKRKIGSTSLQINSSKSDNAVYHSWKCKAVEVPVLCSGDSNLQVNAIDDNWMELDGENTLIEGQSPIKKCSIMLEKCDSAILEKYLGKDWSKNLSKRAHKKCFNVDLMEFEDCLASNSTNDVCSESGNISDSSYQMDSSSEYDDNHSIERALEFCDKKDPKDLFCKLCKKKFKTYSLFLSHDKKTHQSYSFKCILCKAVSKNRESYINHMKRNHPEVEPYVCNYPKCEESFKTKKKLSDHQRSHQRYCCRFCKKRYGKKTLLQRHVSDCH